ncbi:MAG: hypothetical protein AAF739_07585 [Pseudomonadota bacterium]
MARGNPKNTDDTKTSLSVFSIWAGTTLAVAALVHLLVVFALPTIGRAIQIETILPAGEDGPAFFSDSDGAIASRFRFGDARQDTAYCAFDLEDGAVRVAGELDAPFWSISVHTPSGLVVGSVNHRAASGGRLELIVMTPEAATDLNARGAVISPDALIVEMDQPRGLARISGLATFEALRPALRNDLEQTVCELATFSFVPPVETEPDAPQSQQPQRRREGVPSPVPRPIQQNDTPAATPPSE